MSKKVSDFTFSTDQAMKTATGERTELFEISMDSGYKCYVDHITMKGIQRAISNQDASEPFACVKSYHFDTPNRTATLYYNPVYLMYSHISSWRAFLGVTIVKDDEDETEEDGERL